MPARSIKVWNSTTSEWEDVAVASPDTSSFVQNSLVSGKGSLIAATADDTPADLPVGSNGQMLMADSSATAGLRYVDPPANRNLIYNGAMQVHARGTSVTGNTTGGYLTADRWNTVTINMGTWTQTVEDDAPTGSGLRKSLKMLCTTADASPAAGDVVRIDHRLEGQDVQRVRKGTSDAQQLTLSFWVKANVTGTYIANLVDNDNSRQVSASYSISQSATWERKVITFPADTTGALDNDNALSLYPIFYLGAGSDRTSGTLRTSWTSVTLADLAVGQTNLAAATNNYWQITGVQLETGPVATPFEFEPYEATLRKCQRYYYKLSSVGTNYMAGTGLCSSTTRCRVLIPFPTTMRAAPASIETTGTAADYNVLSGSNTSTNLSSVPASNGALTDNAEVTFDVASGLTAGNFGIGRMASSSVYLAWSAEL